MRIAVFGLGYVGVTTAACLTREGHEVIGIDVSRGKVVSINDGRSPISEPGVEELIREAVRKGNLRAAIDCSSAINQCDLAIVCVGTPSAPDGSHDMRFIVEVSREIAAAVDKGREPLPVVYRSTMRPGTMEDLIRPIFTEILGHNSGVIELVYNPEFLRESVAIKDFFNPPKIVIATKDAKPCSQLDALYSSIDAPVFYVGYREAELTKFVDNTFHAVKTAFGNEIGRICHKLSISAQTVHKIFISDTKLNVSANYLRPGGAFGGSCLPKDVRALQHLAEDIGAHTRLIDSLIRSNEEHKHFLFEKATEGLAPGATILMLGLAFKAKTDDLRESPNIDLARKLVQAGYRLFIYDPNVEPATLIGKNLGYAYSTLPMIATLMVGREDVEKRTYDVVLDSRGEAESFCLRSTRIIDLNVME